MKRWIFLSLPLAVGCTTHGDAPPEAAQAAAIIKPAWNDFIKVETVHATDGPDFIKTTGKVSFDEDHTQHVGAPVSGRVAAVKVRLGETVKVGQALVELSSPDVAQLQSDVKKSQEDLELAGKAWGRARTLKSDGAVSDKDAAQAQADFQKARAEVERGKAQLALLGLHASDPVVRAALYARVGGTVVERNLLLGQEVRADSGAPLITITNLDTVWVLADVYEPDLGQVQAGATVRIHVPAYPGETFAGEVAYVGDVVDAQSRTVKVRCVVPNDQHRLKPEMFAKVDIERVADPNGNGKAIFIPTKALVSDGDKTRVLTVSQNNEVQQREVRVGSEMAGRQRVLDGLSEGERIVTDGAVFLQNAISD